MKLIRTIGLFFVVMSLLTTVFATNVATAASSVCISINGDEIKQSGSASCASDGSSCCHRTR